jgi:restriction system protein
MPRRSRRRRGRRHPLKGNEGLLTIVAGLGLIVLLSVLVRQARAHPVAATLIAIGLAGLAAGAVYLWDANRRRLAQHEREVAVTDGMSGDQFEHFTARLMRASGFRRVQVVGGSGDMGADVLACTPDGRRVVVQCKRLAGNLSSPHVQRFAGTARDIHGAEVALLVTTGRPTAQAREVALRCRITLIDRPALAQWLTTQALDC